MIVAGFGFTSRATATSLAQALAATGHASTIDVLAAPDDKVQASCMRDFSTTCDTPVHAVPADALTAAQTQTHSVRSHTQRRTGSVAEAAALAAAGPGATLITTRQISTDRMATCAIAKGADT